MSNRRAWGCALGLSLLIIPVGAIWAMCGLAECDRADCGLLLHALFVTSGVGLLLGSIGVIAACISGVGLVVALFRR